MRLRVVYFAWVRERLGRDGETLSMPDDATVAGVLDQLGAANPGVFDDRAMIRAAVNQTLSPMTAALRDGDELALFPPMTGG